MTLPMNLPMLPMLGAMAALLALAGVVLLRTSQREQRLAARLTTVQRGAGLDQVAAQRSLAGLPARLLEAVGGALVRTNLLSGKTARELEQTLLAAGFRGDRALAVFVGAKFIAFLGLPLLMAVVLSLTKTGNPWWSYLMLGSAAIGLLAPEMIAKRLRKRYLADLERGLADALDLMVICSEAGLSLEVSIERVATEIRPASRAVSTEFGICASEMRILPDRRAALTNMATRTQLDLVRRFAMTLAQTLQFGTPLMQALRTLSAEMRHEQLVRFEERAARLPVLLTVPMILFILPTLFLVVAGPAMLQAVRSW